jgi:hypothetical protein
VTDLFGFQQPVESESECEDMAQLGRLAEFILCARLTSWGYYASHADAIGFDVLVSVEQGHIRVQVKSSAQVRDGKCSWGASSQSGTPNHRGGKSTGVGRYTKRHADVFAFYSRPFDKFVFAPVDGEHSSYRFPVAVVRGCDESSAFAAVVHKVISR